MNKITHPSFNLLAKSFINTVDTQGYLENAGAG